MERWADILRKGAAIVAVFAVGYLGETGKDGGFIRDIWSSLKTASPPVAMVLFFLFLDERRERREAQRQCNDRTIAFTETVISLKDIPTAVAALIKRGGVRK